MATLQDDLAQTLPALQPQRFNALPAGAMSPANNAAPDPAAYGTQMSNVGNFFGNALGGLANFVFNKPGGGGVLDPTRFTAAGPTTPIVPTAAAAPAAASTAAAAPATSGGPDRLGGPQTAPASRAATGTPKTARAAAPQSPLVPGVDGIQMGYNGPVLPWGTTINASGDGSWSVVGGGGGGGGGVASPVAQFADPQAALDYGYQLQQRYANWAMGKILENAGSGSELGYRARIDALARAIGQNAFGGESVGGANALNQAIAHIQSAGLSAAATRYAADRGLAGTLAHVGEQASEFDATPKQEGTTIINTAFGPMSEPTFGMTQRGGGKAPTAINPERPKPAYKPGVVYKDANGNQATYNADGTFTPVK